MKVPALALIAHDAKKEDIVHMAEVHKRELNELELFATKGTGKLLRQRAELDIILMEDGPHGGDQQIGAMVATGEVNAVIFLRDPLMAQPHEPDISALLRICDVHNAPLATNLATAEILLHALLEHPNIINSRDEIDQRADETAAVNYNNIDKEVEC
jgi:methylglyoxal synthase